MKRLYFIEKTRGTEGHFVQDFGLGSLIIQTPSQVAAPIQLDDFVEAVEVVIKERPTWWKKRFGSTEVPYDGGLLQFHLDSDLKDSEVKRLKRDPKRYFEGAIPLPPGYGFHTPWVLAELTRMQMALGVANGETALCLMLPAGAGFVAGQQAFAGLINLKKLRKDRLFTNNSEDPLGLMSRRLQTV